MSANSTARLLALNYGSAKAFVKAMTAAADEDSKAFAELDSIEGIGDTVAKAIAEFFGEDHNRDEVARLLDLLDIEEAEKPKSDTAVSGKTIVFTGSLEKMTRQRSQSAGGVAGCEGGRLGFGENGFGGRRAGGRIEAERSREARRQSDQRRRLAEADRRLAQFSTNSITTPWAACAGTVTVLRVSRCGTLAIESMAAAASGSLTRIVSATMPCVGAPCSDLPKRRSASAGVSSVIAEFVSAGAREFALCGCHFVDGDDHLSDACRACRVKLPFVPGAR